MEWIFIAIFCLVIGTVSGWMIGRTKPEQPYRGILAMLQNKVSLNDFYAAISKRADTAGQEIGADEVSRVMSKAFDVLSEQSTELVMHTIAHGIEVARVRNQDTVQL